MRYIVLLIVSMGILFAKINPLLQKGEHISDIGNSVHVQYVEVPLSKVFYSPEMQIVNNVIVYSKRIATTAECVTDGSNKEACPLDKENCNALKEYSQGSSRKNEAYMSCAAVNVESYHDPLRDKCVLPSEVSDVCRHLPGSYYRQNDDKCVVPDRYDAIKTSEMVTLEYNEASEYNNEVQNNLFYNALRKIVRQAGGTTVERISKKINLSGMNSGFIFNSGRDGYEYTSNNTRPFYIKLGVFGWVTINPGDKIFRAKSINNYNPVMTVYVIRSNGGHERVFKPLPETIYFSSYNSDKTFTYNATATDFTHEGFENKFLEAVRAAGGTALNGALTSTGFLGSSNTYRYLPDHMRTIRMNVNNASWGGAGDCDNSQEGWCVSTSTGDLTYWRNWYSINNAIDRGEDLYHTRYNSSQFGSSSTSYFTEDTYLGGHTATYKGSLNVEFLIQGTGVVPNDGMCLDYDYENGMPVCNSFTKCKSGYAKKEENGIQYCYKESLEAPRCTDPIFTQRDKDECVADKFKYTYYDYSCSGGINEFGKEWTVIDPGGDCGEFNLQTDTNGDGVKDRCNSPTPPLKNCERLIFSCPLDPASTCVPNVDKVDYSDMYAWKPAYYLNSESNGKWEVLGKNSVYQYINGQPTYFLSDYDIQGGTFTMEGRFRTDDPGDNDYFGFVFGFKDQKNYNLLTWSRWKNDTWRGNHDNSNTLESGESFSEPLVDGEIPLALVKVRNYSGSNWHRANIPGYYDVLQRTNNGGWTSGVTYRVKMEISEHDVKVWIGAEGEPLRLDINYHTEDPLDIDGKVGFYNYSISKVTYEDFMMQWEGEGKGERIIKRPLLDMTKIDGAFMPGEYGLYRDNLCSSPDKNCPYALESIVAKGNTLCFGNKRSQEGCFEFNNVCRFDGEINDYLIYNKKLFSFLNSPDEIIDGYHELIEKDFSSPTLISLDFNRTSGSSYPLGQILSSAKVGDQVTVDFWMYWEGNTGMPLGFEKYDLWIRADDSFGFNTANSDVYGVQNISDFKNKWTRVTAIFTHGDVGRNQLYFNGEKQKMNILNTSWLNSNADLTKPLQLSGWGANTNYYYSFNGKIAGLNIYQGALSEKQIARLASGGSRSGISRLKIYDKKIVGYDVNDTTLGEITSTCRLSGKAGRYSRNATIEHNETVSYVLGYYNMKFPHHDIQPPYRVCQMNDWVMEFEVKDIRELHHAVLEKLEFDDHAAIWVNDVFLGEWPNGGTQLEIQSNSPTRVDYGTGTRSCEIGDTSLLLSIELLPYLRDGNNTVRIRTATYGSGNIDASIDLLTSENNVVCANSDTCQITWEQYHSTIEEDRSYSAELVVASPLVAAKAASNRINFWSSYANVGSVGHLEVLKEVREQDIKEGYAHEFEELEKLYSLGFTGFISQENNKTYAISANPMDVSTCMSKLSGTRYTLAEKNSEDFLSDWAINSISYYENGGFGDHCIIQSNGKRDNLNAYYAVKKVEADRYFCSPWGCFNGACGYAECPSGFSGDVIRSEDRATLTSGVCTEQKCDMSMKFFGYCGNPNGCDEEDPTVAQTQGGVCKKAVCHDGDFFDVSTGQCEKTDCAYIKKDGKCLKKLY
jgi:hypothetical protein